MFQPLQVNTMGLQPMTQAAFKPNPTLPGAVLPSLVGHVVRSDSGMFVRACELCSRTETTRWRPGPNGRGTLCQSCGASYRNRTLIYASEGTKGKRCSQCGTQETSCWRSGRDRGKCAARYSMCNVCGLLWNAQRQHRVSNSKKKRPENAPTFDWAVPDKQIASSLPSPIHTPTFPSLFQASLSSPMLPPVKAPYLDSPFLHAAVAPQIPALPLAAAPIPVVPEAPLARPDEHPNSLSNQLGAVVEDIPEEDLVTDDEEFDVVNEDDLPRAVPTRIVKDNVPATSHEVTESELAQARTASDIQKLGIQLLSRTGESKRKQQERERRRELASRQFRPNREIDHPAPSSSAIKVHFRKFKSSKCRYSRSRSHSSSRTSRSRSRETSRGRSRTSSMPLDSPPGPQPQPMAAPPMPFPQQGLQEQMSQMQAPDLRFQAPMLPQAITNSISMMGLPQIPVPSHGTSLFDKDGEMVICPREL